MSANITPLNGAQSFPPVPHTTLERYLDYFALIPIPLDESGNPKKGPSGASAAGWNQECRAVSRPDQLARFSGCPSVGLAHVWSRTCAIDVDDYQAAIDWFETEGVDLRQLLWAPDAVQIKSGKPNRAKLLYRLPANIDPKSLVLKKGPKGCVEFRCADTGGNTLQDVIPPSIHPDTRKAYEWVGDYTQLPELPASILDIWQRLIVEAKPATTDSAAPSVQIAHVTPQQITELRSALNSLDADDREVRIANGIRLKSLGDVGRELWLTWSAQSEKHDPLAAARRWNTFKPTATSYRAVFTAAQAAGWVNPSSNAAKAVSNTNQPMPAPRPKVNLVRVSDIPPESIDWVWNGWLAGGKIHIIGGSAGAGKTTLTLKMAAIISNGGVWPDGAPAPRGNVVIWTGEDGLGDTITPRLMASGANTDRVHVVYGVGEGESKKTFDPAEDMLGLQEAIEQVGNVRLLIIDPIVSAIQGDSHKNAEVRRGLQPLVDLAEQSSCAVLGITHFTKGTKGNDPLERLTGSLAFGAVARIAFVAAKQSQDEGDNAPNILMRVKSNLSRDDGGFEYQLVETQLKDYPDIIITCAQFGNAIEGAARTHLANAEANDEDLPKIDEAKHFLLEELKDGPRSAKELQKAAKDEGIGWRTIERAKSALNVKSRKGMSGWRWHLPEHVDGYFTDGNKPNV